MEASAGGPVTLTPADYWVTFVSNASVRATGQGKLQSRPSKSVSTLLQSSTNVSLIQVPLYGCSSPYSYKDAPYAWLGTFGLLGRGWWFHRVEKQRRQESLCPPVWMIIRYQVFFNTVTFVSYSEISAEDSLCTIPLFFLFLTTCKLQFSISSESAGGAGVVFQSCIRLIESEPGTNRGDRFVSF